MMIARASPEWGNTTQDSSNIYSVNRKKEFTNFTMQEQLSKDSGSNFLHRMDSLNNSGQFSNEAVMNTLESPLSQPYEIHSNNLSHRNTNHSIKRLSSQFKDHSEGENYVNAGSMLTTRHDERVERNFLKDSSTNDFIDAMISKRFQPSELDSSYLKLTPNAATNSDINHDESIEVG